MPRTARYFPSEGTFHVLARGNNRAPIFHQPGDYSAYLAILRNTSTDASVSLHHYCLMPNHVHLLMSAGPPAEALSDFMKRLQLSYAIYYKARYEHTGHLWQDRFKSLWIESEQYFFVCAAYIESNPVVAGLAKAPHEHVFSSYRHHAISAESPWLTPHPLYHQLGATPRERQHAYRAITTERLTHRSEDQLTIGFPVGVARQKPGTVPEPSPS